MNDEELALDAARRLLDGRGGPAVWTDIDDVGAAAVRAALASLIRDEQGLEWADADRRASVLLFEELGRRDAHRRHQEIGRKNMVDPLAGPLRPGQLRGALEGDPDPRNRAGWLRLIAQSTMFWRRGNATCRRLTADSD